MAEFPAFTPSPARVHDRARALVGHHPAWLRRTYEGGLYSTEHYRVCSYCNCIHPIDMMDLLRAGRSWLEQASKGGKQLFVTPNPIAGDLVRMGSCPGPIFPRDRRPADLVGHLLIAARADLQFNPTIGERLTGHFERPALIPAPELIRQPFYAEHTNDHQWAEIIEAQSIGERNRHAQI